jgi:LPPG:FO 2-phospho-L-lactate transferase
MIAERDVVYLSGGVGGARLLHGLARALPAERLTAIVNTGDDFDHWGLRICPDLDTCLYTLAGIGDWERGWGVRGDTAHALAMVARHGGDMWFAIGDTDLGTDLVRSRWLAEGVPLTGVVARQCRALGVAVRVLPMSDDPRATVIDTHDHGTLSLQDWLVRARAEPRVRRVRFEGDARPSSHVVAALEGAGLVVIGPSNPYVSIDPIVTLPGVRDLLVGRPIVALSPIVGGQAVKGPLADMIRDLTGAQPSAAAVARHYGDLLTGMVVERGDERSLGALPALATRTVMKKPDDSERLARELLVFAESLLR